MNSIILSSKVEDYLKKHGFNYSFNEELDVNFYGDDHLPYKRYISLVLRTITGISHEYILQNEKLQTCHVDMQLVNKITECLWNSGDEELKNVAWNTFEYCAFCVHKEDFYLFNEIWNAQKQYYQIFMKDFTLRENHTKPIKTERLVIKPYQSKKDKSLYKFIDEEDEDQIAFIRLASISSMLEIVFYIYLKDTNEVIGCIGLQTKEYVQYDDKEGDYCPSYNFSYYIRKGYRGQGYIKEAGKALIDALKNRKLIVYGDWRRNYVLEEKTPIIQLLELVCDEDNVASFNTAKALGFEYEGKQTTLEQGNYKIRHRFCMRMDK